MALQAVDQFYFIVTSDGTMDRYLEIRAATFKVALKWDIDIQIEED
jgi:hypothetical protein